MAFVAEWFWKMFRPGKKESEPKQHEQFRRTLTPEEAYRKRVAKRKRKAQKGARRRNRK